MQLTDFLKMKGIKQSHLAKTIGMDKSDFCKRVHRNRLWLDEIKLLRMKNILSLEDLDVLTK